MRRFDLRRLVFGVILGLAALGSLALTLPASGQPRRGSREGEVQARLPGAAAAAADATTTEAVTEHSNGEKSYRFRPVVVEGRQRGAALSFVLRRIDREFRLRRLGHRSFLGELRGSRLTVSGDLSAPVHRGVPGAQVSRRSDLWEPRVGRLVVQPFRQGKARLLVAEDR